MDNNLLSKETKKIIRTASLFVMTFIIGYGTGTGVGYKTGKSEATSDIQYTIGEGTNPDNTTTPLPMQGKECKIKGNIGSNGKRIYHVEDGQFFKQVKEEMCFKTESEAVASGFTKSSK